MTIHTIACVHPLADALACAVAPSPAGTAQSPSQGFQLHPVRARHWIGFDDLSFRVDESLTADEVAQALFVLTGGIPGVPGTSGESANYRLCYDEFQPGVLLVSHKAGSSAPHPGLFSTSSI